MDYHHAPSSSNFYVDYGGGRNESDREEMTMQQNGGPIAAKKKDVYVRGRDAQIDNVMKGWQKEFCEWRQAKVLVTTFNVNGRTAPRRIAGWLDGADRADLVVVGLQEMDLSVGTYIMDTGRKEEEWTDCIRASMQSDGGKDDFFLVRGTRLVGIYLTLWRRRASKVPVADVVVAQRPTGLSLGGFSRLGNKGGVAVSCRLFDTTVCFVNAHMAAGDGELMRRNQDFGEIASLTFDEPAPPTLYRHDAVIWLGDLNYRLDGIGYSTDVRQIASGGNFTDLLNHDQLVEQRRLDAAFSRFHEAPITFRPTYKYDCGTSNWDSSEKARTPAWTDRVMWLETGTASEKVVAECEQYTSRDVVVVSDHKPVVARFALRLLQVDTDKANRLYERALRELDRHANELLPQIDISPVELTVATIRYGEPALRTVRIANTGRTIANVKLDCERGAGRNGGGGGWLRVEPTYCSLEPGETTQIAFYMSADEQRMPEDGALEKNLQAIVVVQLQNERSYFVVVQAKFFSPIFGQSLRALLDPTRPKGGEPGGRAKIEEKNLIDFSDEDDMTGRNKKEATAVKDDYDIEGVPPCLTRLAAACRRHGVRQLLRYIDDNRTSGGSNVPSQLLVRLRDALERGDTTTALAQTPEANAYALYSTLGRLTYSLREPVVPAELRAGWLAQETDAFALETLSKQWPFENRRTFAFLLNFLRDVLSTGATSGSPECVLSEVSKWATALVRAEGEAERGKATNALQLLLASTDSFAPPPPKRKG